MINILMKVLKEELSDKPLDNELRNQITPTVIQQLYRISSAHDLAHIVGVALKENNMMLDADVSKLYVRSIYSALMRMERMIYEQDEIIGLFESEEIDYLPLKGAKIKQYYPQKWMRTSCDIDILVRADQLDKAVNLLVEKRAYQIHRRNYHDIVLFSPNGVRLELHFSILEYDEKIDPLLAKVWEYAIRTPETLHGYEMIPEYFMFHLIAHMYYHFVNGGCGIRFFVDLWLLKQHINYNELEFEKLCASCGLKTFVVHVWKLISVWFDGTEHDKTTKKMELYVCTGGLYGNKKSKVTVAKIGVEGDVKYILKRFFVPCKDLENTYPKLKKRPYLYPYFLMKRWKDAYQEGRLKYLSNELYWNKTIKKESVDELRVLFRNLGL